MPPSTSDPRPVRPIACPSCGSKAIGTLAKYVTADTYWRCQSCGEGWRATPLPRKR